MTDSPTLAEDQAWRKNTGPAAPTETAAPASALPNLSMADIEDIQVCVTGLIERIKTLEAACSQFDAKISEQLSTLHTEAEARDLVIDELTARLAELEASRQAATIVVEQLPQG